MSERAFKQLFSERAMKLFAGSVSVEVLTLGCLTENPESTPPIDAEFTASTAARAGSSGEFALASSG